MIETRLSKALNKYKESLQKVQEDEKEVKSCNDMHSLCIHDIDEEHGWDDGW